MIRTGAAVAVVLLVSTGISAVSAYREDSVRRTRPLARVCDQAGVVLTSMFSALRSFEERKDLHFIGPAWEEVLKDLGSLDLRATDAGDEQLLRSVRQMQEDWTALTGNRIPEESGATYFIDGMRDFATVDRRCEELGVLKPGPGWKPATDLAICNEAAKVWARIKAIHAGRATSRSAFEAMFTEMLGVAHPSPFVPAKCMSMRSAGG